MFHQKRKLLSCAPQVTKFVCYSRPTDRGLLAMERQIIPPQVFEGPVPMMSFKIPIDCLSPSILRIEEPKKCA